MGFGQVFNSDKTELTYQFLVLYDDSFIGGIPLTALSLVSTSGIPWQNES
jgi:hypothetical protein